MNKRLLLFLIISVSILSYSASDTGENDLYKYLEITENKLDSDYSNLIKNIDEKDNIALEDSQNDWVDFRNSNCNFKSQNESQGGAISNKLYISCQIELTENRIEELTDLLLNGF